MWKPIQPQEISQLCGSIIMWEPIQPQDNRRRYYIGLSPFCPLGFRGFTEAERNFLD